MLTSLSLSAFAASLEDQLEELQGQMSNQRSKIEQAGQKVDTVSEELRHLQAELDQAISEYEAVEKELNNTEEKIVENAAVLQKTEKALDKRMTILGKRVRDIYQNGQISYVEVLFGAKDFSDFMTRMDLLKRIIKADFNLITEIKGERELILSTRAALERDKAAIEALKVAAAEKRQQMEDSKSKKAAALDKAVNDRDRAEQAYQEMLAASAEVENLIRQSHYRPPTTGSGSGHSTGRMIWPLRGEITSEYGWRTHPIFGTSKYHSGLDIGGDYGLPIVAADGGVVVYAGWISGYGNAVIIDHGGGLSTLYGHNDSLAVSEGQNVSQGQLIAYCGSTGYSTGPHCHFEVREDGSPVNPYNYL